VSGGAIESVGTALTTAGSGGVPSPRV